MLFRKVPLVAVGTVDEWDRNGGDVPGRGVL